MTIIINDIEFGYDIGCRILKTKYGNKPFSGLEDIWDEIPQLTFSEICQLIPNIEQRRVAFVCLGFDTLASQVDGKLVDVQNLMKTTTWVDANGELKEHKYIDIYELYKVSGAVLFKGVDNVWQTRDDYYFVKFKDTSTEREYIIWVELNSVVESNNRNIWSGNNTITATEAIAWTIQTDVPAGNIEKIVRQGDCVLIKKISNQIEPCPVRHLSAKEYMELLVIES